MKVSVRLSIAVFALSGLCSIANAQISVNHRLATANALEIFFLRDFDITNPSSGPPIFFVDIQNDNQPRDVRLSLQVSSQRFGPLSRGVTVRFSLAPNAMLSLSNNDLFTNSGPYRFAEYQTEEGILRELLDNILSTGRLPTDVYRFDVRVQTVDGTSQSTDTFDIRISNPNKLDLIFPGSPVSGRRDDCRVLFTHLPQFRWESDMTRFRVLIAEARPGEDPEAILQQEPRFARNFVLASTRRSAGNLIGPGGQRFIEIASTSFQYPASGELLSMRPGRVYYWRVIGLVESSAGLVRVPSEIFCFRIPRMDRVDGGMAQLQIILRRLLGSDYDQLFGEGGEFDGYRPRSILWKGEQVSFSELLTNLPEMADKFSGYKVLK